MLNANHRSAVTLIETVLVITLLAAAAMSAAVMFDQRWVARRSVASATNDIANSLILARNTAVANRAPVTVRPLRRNGLALLNIEAAAGPLRDAKLWTVSLGSEIRISGSPQSIRFSPVGSTDRGLRWTVQQTQVSGVVTVAARDGNVERTLP